MTKPKGTGKYSTLRTPANPELTTAPEATATQPEGQAGDQAKPATVQLNVQVPRELRIPFRVKAMQEGRTMSEVVTEWIEAYLRK